jgi:hypothetical protein
MPDNVKSALLELRRVERQLGRTLARAMRSGDPRKHKMIVKQIAVAERHMQRLERELGTAS